MKFLSKAKNEIICALFNCACREAQSLGLSLRRFSVITIINGLLERVGKTNIEYLVNELSIDTEMTLQNLDKILTKYELQVGSTNTEQFELLKDLPFYDSSLADVSHKYHRNTFNHAIGLPQKNGQPMPLFDYEQMLFDILQTNKHVWIKKATGTVLLRLYFDSCHGFA